VHIKFKEILTNSQAFEVAEPAKQRKQTWRKKSHGKNVQDPQNQQKCVMTQEQIPHGNCKPTGTFSWKPEI
jgi:hypothetical protein